MQLPGCKDLLAFWEESGELPAIAAEHSCTSAYTTAEKAAVEAYQEDQHRGHELARPQ